MSATDRFLLRFPFAVSFLCLLPSVGFGQTNQHSSPSPWPLFWAELALLAVVLLVLPALSLSIGRTSPKELRGLGLPRGSVRSMLALVIVGSTVNFLLFGDALAGSHFTEMLTALSTLSAAVIGFYFGGRTATPLPQAQERSSSDPTDAPPPDPPAPAPSETHSTV